jgi:hypothetical protein
LSAPNGADKKRGGNTMAGGMALAIIIERD